MEDGNLVAMLEGELNEGLDELEWWTLLSGGITKYMAGVSINNGED